MRSASALALMIVLIGSGRSGDQLAAQEAGDEVVPKRAIPLKVKSTVVDTVGPDAVLVVEQRQGDWLWVRTSTGQTGWVKADAVILPEEAAPGSPDEPADLPPADEPTSTDPQAERLYLIGAMGGAHVYTTYAYIGVLADSLSKDLYTVKQVQDLLKETLAMSQSLVKRLERVRAGGLSEEDQQAINKMIEIHRSLQDLALATSRFAASRSAQDAEAFDAVRNAVWPRISELLGIENTEAQSSAQAASP